MSYNLEFKIAIMLGHILTYRYADSVVYDMLVPIDNMRLYYFCLNIVYGRFLPNQIAGVFFWNLV